MKSASKLKLDSKLVDAMRKEFLAFMKRVSDGESAMAIIPDTIIMRETIRKFGKQLQSELEGRARVQIGNTEWAQQYIKELDALWKLSGELGHAWSDVASYSK